MSEQYPPCFHCAGTRVFRKDPWRLVCPDCHAFLPGFGVKLVEPAPTPAPSSERTFSEFLDDLPLIYAEALPVDVVPAPAEDIAALLQDVLDWHGPDGDHISESLAVRVRAALARVAGDTQ